MLSFKELKSIKTDHLVNALGILIFEWIKLKKKISNPSNYKTMLGKMNIQLIYNFKFLYQQFLKLKKNKIWIYILRSLDLFTMLYTIL